MRLEVFGEFVLEFLRREINSGHLVPPHHLEEIPPVQNPPDLVVKT
jgi:hypothetical protein